MSVSEAVLSYLRVLVWPTLVGVIAFGFRSTIRSLLRVRLTQIDAAGFSVKFEDAAQDAKRLVHNGQLGGRGVAHWAAVSERDLVRFKPHSYMSARAIGEAFRAGKPVLIDLSKLDDDNARRLVDFSAGLIFMGRGSIDRLRDRVFILTPAASLRRDDPRQGDDGDPSVPSKV